MGRSGVEQLARVEAVAFVAADGGDDIVEIVEHDVLLRRAAWRRGGAPCAPPCRTASAIASRNGLEVRLLAVRGDRHVGRRDVEPDGEVACPSAPWRRCGEARSRTGRCRACRAQATISPVTGVRLTQTSSRMSSLLVRPTPRPRTGSRRAGSAPNVASPLGDGIGAVGEAVGTDRAEPLRVDRLGIASRAASSSRAACSRSTSRQAMRPSPAAATISPARPPAQPSRLATSSRTGALPLADSSSWNCGASYQYGDDLPA